MISEQFVLHRCQLSWNPLTVKDLEAVLCPTLQLNLVNIMVLTCGVGVLQGKQLHMQV